MAKIVYAKLNKDGAADITLSKPLKIGGVDTTALRMREPTVRDQIVMDETEGGAALKEVTFFANLCGLVPDDLLAMGTRDYKRVQDAFGLFTD